MARYRQPDPSQYRIVTLNFDDLFPPEHPTSRLLSLIRSFDLSEFDDGYHNDAGTGGRPALPPDRILAVMIYSLLYGNLSMRNLSRDLEQRADLMYLSGGLKIDHSTFTVFRNRHAKAIMNLFSQTVFMGVRSGLINLETVCIDSTKIKACANADDIGTEEKLRRMYSHTEKACEKRYAEWENADETDKAEKEKKLREAQMRKEKIDEALAFLKEHAERKRIHIHDHDAEIQKCNGKFLVGYNIQQAVDHDSRMIVYRQVHTKQGDTEFTVPVIQGLEKFKEELFAEQPETRYLLDAGYASEENLEKLDGMDIYMPDARFARDAGLGGKVRPEDRKERDRRPESNEVEIETIPDNIEISLKYDQNNDEFICPAGERLKRKKTRFLNGNMYHVFRKNACSGCKYRIPCVGNRGTRKDIMVLDSLLKENLVYSPRKRAVADGAQFKRPSRTELMRQKLSCKEGRKVYSMRMIIEGVFGTAKNTRKGREFLRRGIGAVSVEYAERAIAHNIARILKLLQGRMVATI